MVAAFHIAKFILKLLLLIIFLPIVILWLLVKYCIYRTVLIHNLIQSGMPGNIARRLAEETNLRKIFR